MEDLLIAVLQGIFEFLVEVFSYAPLDWPFSRTDRWRSGISLGKMPDLVHHWLWIGVHHLFISPPHMDFSSDFPRPQSDNGTDCFRFHFRSGGKTPEPAQSGHHSTQSFLAGLLVHAGNSHRPLCLCGERLNGLNFLQIEWLTFPNHFSKTHYVRKACRSRRRSSGGSDKKEVLASQDFSLVLRTPSFESSIHETCSFSWLQTSLANLSDQSAFVSALASCTGGAASIGQPWGISAGSK